MSDSPLSSVYSPMSSGSDCDTSSLATTADLQSLQVCRRYFNGCCKSKDCIFAHEILWDETPPGPRHKPSVRIRADVRTLTRKEVNALTQAPRRETHRRKSTEICMRFVRGMCKSNPCRFLHTQQEPPSAATERFLENFPRRPNAPFPMPCASEASFLQVLGVDSEAFKAAQAVQYTD